MKYLLSVLSIVIALASSNQTAADVINPTEDVMTSAFFTSGDFVRGYAGDGRAVHRVSSDNAFGTGPETVYIQFDQSYFAGLSGPVNSAVLSVTGTAGGFGADATSTNPFLVSAHSLSADPFTSIVDNNITGGTMDWLTFFNTQIDAANPESMTAIDGFGIYEFDITSIVNDWISGANTIYSVALTGKNGVQVGNGFLHGFVNNTETPGSTYLTVSAVPEPGTASLATILIGLIALRRTRK